MRNLQKYLFIGVMIILISGCGMEIQDSSFYATEYIQKDFKGAVTDTFPTIAQPGDTVIKQDKKLDVLEGVTANDVEDGDLTSSVKVDNPYNFKGDGTDAVDEYSIIYIVVDSDGHKTESIRKISVIPNLKPTITQPGDTSIKVRDEFDILEGVSAIDADDGDLTAEIKVDADGFKGDGTDLAGTYTITYSVTDSDDNMVTSVRKITVVSNKPIIKQPGDVTIKVGTHLNILQDVEAIDTEDGDLTAEIKVDADGFKGDGSDLEGKYSIVYTVTDSDGNTVTSSRIINVITDEPTKSTDTNASGTSDIGSKEIVVTGMHTNTVVAIVAFISAVILVVVKRKFSI